MSRLTIHPLLLCVALGLCGCRPRAKDADRFVPAPGVAKAAVTGALERWKRGEAVNTGAESKPAVRVIDDQRKPGQRLARFEVIGEVASESGRTFAIRLSLENPDEELIVRYLVIGIDPLLVYRKEDYDMLMHWTHRMDGVQPAATPPSVTP